MSTAAAETSGSHAAGEQERTDDLGLHPGPGPVTASLPRIAALEAPAASLEEARAACGPGRAGRTGGRRRVRAVGRVVEIRIAAATERPACEALLLVDDPRRPAAERPAVRLVWQGQRSVPGVRAGTDLACSGLLCRSAGQPTIFNPRFEIIARKAT